MNKFTLSLLLLLPAFAFAQEKKPLRWGMDATGGAPLILNLEGDVAGAADRADFRNEDRRRTGVSTFENQVDLSASGLKPKPGKRKTRPWNLFHTEQIDIENA